MGGALARAIVGWLVSTGGRTLDGAAGVGGVGEPGVEVGEGVDATREGGDVMPVVGVALGDAPPPEQAPATAAMVATATTKLRR